MRRIMAKLRIRNENIELDVPDGSAILPYLWEHTSFPQACDDGSTPMCACTIISGEENLSPKTQREIETLHRAGLPNSWRNRLACQIWIKKGMVEIEY
jgi:ferredoxin